MHNKRIYKFDNLKFLLILLVVIGHFADLYVSKYNSMRFIFIVIYSFHMPLFLFITGLFQKRINSFKDISLQKILFYIFLIYFMKISMFCVGKHYQSFSSFELFSGTEGYWYLSVIIIYTLILSIISKLKFSYILIFSLIMGLVVGYDNSINDFLYLSRAIVFFPFYLLGYNYSNNKKKILEITSNKKLKVISIIIIIAFLCYCINNLDYIYRYRALFTGRNPYSYIADLNCTYKHRLLTYFISFIICFCIMCIIPNKKIKIITNLGKKTLQVYVLHQTIIMFMNGIGLFNQLEKNFSDYFIYIYLLIAVILTFFLSLRLFTKIFNYIKNTMFVN